MRGFWVVLLIGVIISCNSNSADEAVRDEVVEVVDFEYDSLRTYYKDLVSVMEVNAILKPTNGIDDYHVYRSVDLYALSNDTLKYSTDWSLWNNPDSTKASDKDFQFQFKIALSDIDTSKISWKRLDDLVWVFLPEKDTLKGTWSKFDNRSGQRIWEVPASKVTFSFLTSIEKIQQNFKSYSMYDVRSGEPKNFVNYSVDSISGLKLFEQAHEAIRSVIESQ